MNTRIKFSKLLKAMGLLGIARAIKMWITGKLRNMLWSLSKEPKLSNELPIPPPSLCFTVSANYNIEYFLRTGLQGAESIKEILARNGKPINDFSEILDFGCGCGRITRHWRELTKSNITGSDINPKLIRWAQKNLSFADFITNGISDVLPFDNDSFDLIYAVSVFTHLSEKLQKHWMGELTRILKPGGALLITVKGENWKVELDEDQQNSFDLGKMVVLEPENSGSNYCGAYHPPEHVRTVLGAGLNMIEHEPCGSKDTRQDFYLMNKLEYQS